MILILRCADIEKTRAFYEEYGYKFKEEQHYASGPRHYAWSKDDIVFELYPASDKEGNRAGETTIMIDVDSGYDAGCTVASDPDGRRILLNHTSK